jgi:hypothetical protein
MYCPIAKAYLWDYDNGEALSCSMDFRVVLIHILSNRCCRSTVTSTINEKHQRNDSNRSPIFSAQRETELVLIPKFTIVQKYGPW